ncbi:MAG: helix-turn-helix transcriptional regulator [Acidobacteria bacterium]|nr:helix-turn-helix transcriptional regulator [Acidobacteriota bacterium]
MRGSKRSPGYYSISVVAKTFGIHPQTLRLYEREGLLEPTRTDGNTRLYSDEDIKRLEAILNLTRELGVNLAGVDIILKMREQMETMQNDVNELLSAFRQIMVERLDDGAAAYQHSLIRVAPKSFVVRVEEEE